MTTDNSPAKKSSRLIGKILAPAIQLWLKSQVQHVSHLEIDIQGKSRQIITGNIPRVSILARDIVYQGLQVREIHLVATGILINLGQVIQGQPLKLLEKVPVIGKLRLQQEDINRSLRSPILADALTELFLKLAPNAIKGQICGDKVIIDDGCICVHGNITDHQSDRQFIIFRASLKLSTSRELEIVQPSIETSSGVVTTLNNCKFDLGEEVELEELTLEPGKIICSGKINVLP